MITCRTPAYHSDWGNQSTQGVVISSKLVQDSVCGNSNSSACDIDYMEKDDSPILKGISRGIVYSNAGSVTLTGLNLDLIPAGDVKVVF